MAFTSATLLNMGSESAVLGQMEAPSGKPPHLSLD
jgi:hypothetical protein